MKLSLNGEVLHHPPNPRAVLSGLCFFALCQVVPCAQPSTQGGPSDPHGLPEAGKEKGA